jgi:DNA-binding CsgD family transcriptional regulator
LAAGSTHLPPSVGAAAQAVVRSRGEGPKLKRVFDRSPVPMLTLDDQRRHVEVNRPARLVLRMSLAQMRRYTPDEVVPPDELSALEPMWARLLEAGSVTGQSVFAGPDGGRLDVVYWGLANALPGIHLFAFAPAGWPEDELGTIEDETADRAAASLTPREQEVLQLAAGGLSGPEIAERLVLSPSTVKTHFGNLYEKLGVGDRTAAVAKGMRLGLID